jgi:hypothetical protein
LNGQMNIPEQSTGQGIPVTAVVNIKWLQDVKHCASF